MAGFPGGAMAPPQSVVPLGGGWSQAGWLSEATLPTAAWSLVAPSVGAAIVWEMVRLKPSARNVTDQVPGDRVIDPEVRPAEFVGGKLAERVPPGPLAVTETGSPSTACPSSHSRVTV
jgi:hypothetical protein